MEGILFYGIVILELFAVCMIGFGCQKVIVRRCGALLLVVCLVLYTIFAFCGTDEVYAGVSILGSIGTIYILLLYVILALL